MDIKEIRTALEEVAEWNDGDADYIPTGKGIRVVTVAKLLLHLIDDIEVRYVTVEVFGSHFHTEVETTERRIRIE